MLQEPGGLVVSQAYSIHWQREYLDLTELARLRWIEHWRIDRLALHFGVSRTAIEERIRAVKQNPQKYGLTSKPIVLRGK
jgi:hypothetical protein